MTMAMVSGIINNHHHCELLYTGSKIMMELRGRHRYYFGWPSLVGLAMKDSNDFSLPANV